MAFKINVIFLVEEYIYGKNFHEDLVSLSRDTMSQIMEKALFCNVKESSKNFRSRSESG